MKKLFILNIILLSLSIAAFGQNILPPEYEEERTEIINNSTYIFEGVPLRFDSYEVGGESYTYSIIEVKKVFRGNIQKGTIELVGPLYIGDPMHYHSLMYLDRKYIFFCIASDYPVNPSPPSKSNSVVVMRYPSYEQSLINVDYTGGEYDLVGLAYSKFKSKETFYNYLKKFPGIIIPPDEPTIKKAQTATPLIPFVGIDSVERQRRHKENLKAIKAKDDSVIYQPGEKTMYEKFNHQ